jgi:hypothetical protein
MNSKWVNSEIGSTPTEGTEERRQVIFPITIVPLAKIREWKNMDVDTGKNSARQIQVYFVPDFSNRKDHDSYQTAFERLVRDLKAAEPGEGKLLVNPRWQPCRIVR